jgi:two-component system, NarL family, nitrate/nitrite response regulator NarL
MSTTTPRPAVTVVVADDHPAFVAGVAATLAQDPRIEVLGTAPDGAQALAAITQLRPDVALLDLAMPELDGIEVLRALRDRGSSTAVVFLAATADGATVHTALTLGAKGFLEKLDEIDRIRNVVVAAGRGGTPQVSPQLAVRAVGEISSLTTQALSHREREALLGVATGQTVERIADQCALSPATIKTYLQRSYAKLGVSSAPAAVHTAWQRGILS